MLLRVTNLQKSYGTKDLFSEVTFSLHSGDKVAVVGPNGSGKSTLLRIIAGVEQADSGEVVVARHCHIGYLPQEIKPVGNISIIDYIKYETGIAKLESRLQELEQDLDNPKNIAEYEEVQREFLELDGYSFEHKVETILSGFGLDSVATTHPVQDLSSGQKTKVVLTAILLKGVDLLVLDEPTNNLDLPALIWLDEYLRTRDVACLVVSHDRKFLDHLVKKVYEIDPQRKGLREFSGGYSNYLEHKKKELEKQLAQYEAQQEEIGRLTQSAERLKQKAQAGSKYVGTDNDKFIRGFKREQSAGSSRVAKTIEKRIEKMDEIERPIEREKLSIPLTAANSQQGHAVVLHEVRAGYDSSAFSIGPISLSIPSGSRVVIMGRNGTGKSTLLKTISGEMKPLDGSVSLGTSMRFGILMQEHENLPKEMTAGELLMERGGVDQSESYWLLSRFNFNERDFAKKVAVMSPGERTRLILALFSAQSVNVLILDEPTNHLDIDALEAVEDVLDDYQGTVIVVSHDRAFLEKLEGTDTYLLENGKLEHIRNLTEYIEGAEKRAHKIARLV